MVPNLKVAAGRRPALGAQEPLPAGPKDPVQSAHIRHKRFQVALVVGEHRILASRSDSPLLCPQRAEDHELELLTQ